MTPKYTATVGNALVAEKMRWFTMISTQNSSFYLGPFKMARDANLAKEKLDVALKAINALVKE